MGCTRLHSEKIIRIMVFPTEVKTRCSHTKDAWDACHFPPDSLKQGVSEMSHWLLSGENKRESHVQNEVSGQEQASESYL